MENKLDPEARKVSDDLKLMQKDLQEQVSALRKKGFDSKLIDVLLLAIGPKIQIAVVTMEKKDIDKAKNYMESIRVQLPDIRTLIGEN